MRFFNGAAAMAVASAMTCAAQAATYSVATNAQLVAAVKAAKGGDTIRVQPGNYGDLDLKGINPSSAVQIVAANSSRLPVFTNIALRDSSNLRFTRLAVYSPAPGPDNVALTGMDIYRSTDIRVSGMVFSGVPGGGVSNEARGLRLSGSKRIQVAGNRFEELSHGITTDGSSHMTVTDNLFDHIRINGLISDGASNSTISRNRMSNFHPEAGDHPDGIQIYTSGNLTTLLTISDNLILSEADGQTQGIFIDSNVTENRRLLDRITISDNVISGTMWTGIGVIDAARITVDNNQLYSNQLALAYKTWVRLENIDAVNVTDNLAGNFLYMNVDDVAQSGNVIQLTNLGAAAAIALWDATHSAGALWSLDSSAAESLAGRMGGALDLDGVARVAASVPEPASWISLIAGFGIIGGALRRLQRRSGRRMARA